MLINNTESELNCKNAPIHCNKNIHEIMMEMGADSSLPFINLFKPEFLFYWDNLKIKSQRDRFERFLIKNYNVNWVKNAEIKYFRESIRLFASFDYLEILKCNENEAMLIINSKKTEKLYLEQKILKIWLYIVKNILYLKVRNALNT